MTIGEGDAVLLRSGAPPPPSERGAWNPARRARASTWTRCRCWPSAGIALLGGDGDSDVRPSPVDGLHSPVHALAITAMGVPLLDNLDLEALSAVVRRGGPLRVPARRGAR